MAERVTIFEMGPRDGLQNEARQIPTEDKIRLVDLLSDCGFAKIEVASFVSPKWVPQMADSEEVLRHLRRQAGVSYPVLVPNMKGLERALAVGVEEIAIFAAASETFSQRNINCGSRQLPGVALAHQAELTGSHTADLTAIGRQGLVQPVIG